MGKGTAGIVHFFQGLMLADGAVSQNEIDKVNILVYKFRKRLPGTYENTVQRIDEMNKDADYKNWTADHHLEKGLEFWQAYANSGEADQHHLEAIIDIVEIVSEIDDVTEGEREYIRKMEKEFKKRFGYQSVG
jgi:hypothetical protein